MTFVTSIYTASFGYSFVIRADYSSERMNIGKTTLVGCQVVVHLPAWSEHLVEEANKSGVISPQLARVIKCYGRVDGYSTNPFQREDGIKKDVDYDIIKKYRAAAERNQLPKYDPEKDQNLSVLYCTGGYDPRWVIKATEVAYPLFSMSGCRWLIMQK